MSWQYHVIELPMRAKIQEGLIMLKSRKASLLVRIAAPLVFLTESARVVDFILAER